MSLVFSLGFDLARLQPASRAMGQTLLCGDELGFQLRQQGIGAFCGIALGGGEIQVFGVARAVIADRHEEPAFHHHLGPEVLRVADRVQDDVDRLPEALLPIGGGFDPGFDVNFVH